MTVWHKMLSSSKNNTWVAQLNYVFQRKNINFHLEWRKKDRGAEVVNKKNRRGWFWRTRACNAILIINFALPKIGKKFRWQVLAARIFTVVPTRNRREGYPKFWKWLLEEGVSGFATRRIEKWGNAFWIFIFFAPLVPQIIVYLKVINFRGNKL